MQFLSKIEEFTNSIDSKADTHVSSLRSFDVVRFVAPAGIYCRYKNRNNFKKIFATFFFDGSFLFLFLKVDQGSNVFTLLNNEFRGQFGPKEYSQESILTSVNHEIMINKNFLQKIIHGLIIISEAKCRVLVETHVR